MKRFMPKKLINLKHLKLLQNNILKSRDYKKIYNTKRFTVLS